MLEFFRQHLGGLFGIVVIGLLVIAFSLSFGTQSKGWGKSQTEHFAAKVDGTKIPESTFRYAVNLVGGMSGDRTEEQRSALQVSVLHGLIERQLLLNMAEDMGVSASIDEAEKRIIDNNIYLTQSLELISNELKSNIFIDPLLAAQIMVSDGHRARQSLENTEGKFDLEMYKNFVRYHLQMTEESFVEQQRLEIIAERMRKIIASAVRVSENEVLKAYQRENNTASIEYIRLIPSYFSNQLTPSKEELTAWASEHADEIKQYYETNKFKYTNLEKMVRARHILIKVDESASDEDKQTARKKIDKILARAKTGADFAALARENSEDEESAKKGGDLGFNPKGRMVAEFDEAMFAAKPGEITNVVQTKYGFHVIKVEDTREGNITLEDATPEIAEILFGEAKGAELAKSTADSFMEKLKAGGTMQSLIEGSEGKENPYSDLKVMTSDEFTAFSNSISGIGEAPVIIAAAFKLTTENPLPEKAFEVRNDYYVFKLAKRNLPSDEEFKKVKDTVTTELLAVKQGSWLKDQIAAIVDRAEKEGRIEILDLTTPSASTRRGAKQGNAPAPGDKNNPKAQTSDKASAKDNQEADEQEQRPDDQEPEAE